MKLKELCEQLGYEYNSKNPKRSLEIIKKDYLIEQNGNKKDYTIIRELSPQEKYSYISKRQLFFKDYNKNKMNKSGIYKIQLDDNVYIGQTKNFYKRLIQHYDLKYIGNNKSKTYDMLRNGAKMEILEEADRTKRLERESYWSNRYKYFGYNVINNFEVLYKNEKEYKIIKIPKINYKKAIELLQKEGLL